LLQKAVIFNAPQLQIIAIPAFTLQAHS